jgi:hypothetical protein
MSRPLVVRLPGVQSDLRQYLETEEDIVSSWPPELLAVAELGRWCSEPETKAVERVVRAAEAWADKCWPADDSAEGRELLRAVRALRELRGEP